MSMGQQWAGPGDWLDPAGFMANDTSKKYRVYYKRSQIDNAPMRFVFVDEHPDSINAGGFANMMVENAANARIIDFPASYPQRGLRHILLGWAHRNPQVAGFTDARAGPLR